MRELKFKAWLPAIKKMTHEHTLDELMNWNTEPKDNGTAVWLQYTGLNDSKRTAEYPDGQPIYEGDIIKAELPQKCYDGVRNLRLAFGKVYFDKGSFKVTDRVADVRLDDFANDVVLEVLGNVYDDPGLLVRWS